MKAKDGRKTCSKCSKDFPATADYFYRDRTTKVDGLACLCKKCVGAMNRRWRERNPERLRANLKRWRERNPKKDNAYRRQYMMHRRQTNPKWRLHQCISTRVLESLAGGKAGRSWEKLVGYTVQELQAHLESLFKRGMTWSNHSRHGWHVDHIRPVASFLFVTPDDPDFRECWALHNLRPLWAKENCNKQARWDGQAVLPFASAVVYCKKG